MWRVIGINILILAVLLVCLEAALAWLVARDSPTGIRPVDRLARKIYWANVSYVQYLPDCARYDPELGYTLRPGNCVFENTGFSTELDVNSAGYRDNEASLDAPEIVVLGDSQAMGWGVGQGKTFADIIEAETGRKTLNTGVSSYGTARELMALDRVDLSNLKTVIIQYSDNDGYENRHYLSEGTLSAMSEETYSQLVAGNEGTGGGFGHYLPALFQEVRGRFGGSDGEGENSDLPMADLKDPDVLTEVLTNWDWGVAPPQLVVFDVNTGGRGGRFTEALSTSPKLSILRSKIPDLKILHTPEILDAEDYLFPDGHLSETGHQKLAGAIIEVIAQN
ncbi:hypothetical protein [Ruegeria arenilitoris]|uniref:hypothetical protein n=1 Tax=Ruegeria arenilitoris TaxID=1173585 RepID=UPI001479CDC8|nr:hypothetical protein [Ruegeria arenilitoris]